MVFAAFLSSHPLVQTILYVVISVSMITYVIWRKPIQNKLDYINIFVLEGVIFLANMAALTIVGMHMAGNTNMKVRNALAELIIVASYIINYMSIIFLITKVVSNIRLAMMHRKSASKYEEKAVWLNMLFLPFQQGGMGFEQVQLLQGVDSGKQVSKIIPDQTTTRLVKNVSAAGSGTSPEIQDRSLFELDSTVMGSPSPLKAKQNRRTRFSFKKTTKDAIDPVVEGMPDASVSNVIAPSLNITAQIDGSATNRELLPSARETRVNSPLLKVRRSDESAFSKIELASEENNMPLINSVFVPTPKNASDSTPLQSLQESPLLRSQSPGTTTPEPLDSPLQRLNTPDKDKSFLERARLRRKNHTFKKFDEDEMVFSLSNNNVEEKNSDENKSEQPSPDEVPVLQFEKKSLRRRKIARNTDED